MVVEFHTIKKLLDKLEVELGRIENMRFSRSEYLENPDVHELLDRRLHIVIEACMDIAAHIAAGLALPGRDTAGDVFFLLGQHGIIPKKLAKIFKEEVVGFRNILVHEYADIDYPRVYRGYKKDIQDLRSFAEVINKFLEKNPHLIE